MGKKYTQKKRFKPKECTDEMTFQDCELAVLRHAVDENEKISGEKMASSSEIKRMIQIVEDFLVRKKLICYGGTAINNILPKSVQFYDKSYQIPDYDFFSSNALDDAKELADVFYKEGYLDVEAKSGVHEGTYKVFVNFIPMADVTMLHKELFQALLKESIKVAGIYYAPPNFLRMGMYLELSRPAGDISRWEKVLKRLNLLNEYHPMKVEYNCATVDFQRKMDDKIEDSEKIYYTVRDTFIDLGVVFFGGYASSLYSKYMPKHAQRFVQKIPDFDVLSEDPERTATIVTERLEELGFKNINTKHHAAYGEIIPEHIELSYGKDIVAFIYKPIACHNYNTITIDNREINVATIDTIMNFYLAFLYSDAGYYYKDRILCMAQYLFEVERKMRLSQTGLLKRFSSKCIGTQETMESIRANKAARFAELRKNRKSREFEEVFLKYEPGMTDQSPKKEAPKKEAPKKESPKESPKEESPKEESPKEESPKEESPKKRPKKGSKKEQKKTRKISNTRGVLRKLLFPL